MIPSWFQPLQPRVTVTHPVCVTVTLRYMLRFNVTPPVTPPVTLLKRGRRGQP